MRIALLCLLLCAPLAAGEKTDAAVKRLGEQLEKIGKEQAQRRPPRKVAENGWEAFVKFCNDTDALDGDDDHDWKDALTDPTQDFTTHTPETARLALEKTAGIPAQVAALARLPRIVMIPDPKVEPSKQIPVLPMLEAFRFALGRVVLLAESGQHDAARAEARNLAALVGKLDLRASSLGMLAESGMRGSVLHDGLLIHLGRPGWDTKFARELMALVPRPSWDVAELLDGELAGMLDESRRLFLGKDAAGIGKVPAGEADPDAWMAGQIDSATDTIGAVNQAIVELRDKPARADTADGMARLTAVLKRMGEAGASEDARYVVSHPLRCAVRESLYWAAIELRLADLEKPLAGRIQDGRKLLERFPGLKLKLDGKTPVVFIDPDAEWQKQLSFAQENEIRIEARAAR